MGLRVQVLTRQGVCPRQGVNCVSSTGNVEGILRDREFCAGEESEFLRSLYILVLAPPAKAT